MPSASNLVFIGKTEISAALVEPLAPNPFKAVKRKNRALTVQMALLEVRDYSECSRIGQNRHS